MNRYREVILALYNHLGYTIDDEILKVLLCDARHILVKAPAGGTKTTLSQVYINMEKLKKLINASVTNRREGIVESTSYNIEDIQTFVYNTHNVNDIYNVNHKIYSAFAGLNLFSTDPSSPRYVNPSISISTVHSFAYDVIENHKQLFKLRTVKKASDWLIELQLSHILKETLNSNFNVKDYKACYDLYTSLMLYKTKNLDVVEFKSEVLGKGIEFNLLANIFDKFDLAKKRLGMYEYSDWLKMTDNLLDNSDIKSYYQNRFKILVADEIQDFTPLMFSIYSKVISEKTKTLGIGDSDQTLYRFMGASPENLDKYSEILNIPVEVFNLSVNRRCAKDTFFYARNLRDEIKLNKGHEIITPRKKGRFVHLMYDTLQEESDLIINEIQKISYDTTAILVREQIDSLLLSRALYKLGIRVNYINALSFNQHSLYFNFKSILDKLIISRTPDTWAELYKILPFTKDQLNKFFEFDRSGYSLKFADVQDWKYIDFSPLANNLRGRHSILNQVIFVQGIADNYLNLATYEYIPLLFEMYFKNFYQFISNPSDVYIDEVGKWIIEDFSGYNNLRKVKADLEQSYNLLTYKSKERLTISTIHGSKGLEFSRVIVSHMEDSLKVFKSVTQEERDYNYMNLIRLFYVACTRQRDCLVLLSNKNKPFTLLSDKLLTKDNTELNERYNGISFSQLLSNDSTLTDIRPKFKL